MAPPHPARRGPGRAFCWRRVIEHHRTPPGRTDGHRPAPAEGPDAALVACQPRLDGRPAASQVDGRRAVYLQARYALLSIADQHIAPDGDVISAAAIEPPSRGFYWPY